MSPRQHWRPSLAKLSIWVFVAVALVSAAGMVKLSQGDAMPANPTDGTKVPHYFGPWTNWALSPLTAAAVNVDITGDGSGATAAATVDPVTGGVASIAIVTPGSGYTAATVVITGAGTSADATASVSTTGTVTGVTVDAAGSGYSGFDIQMSGGGGTGAAADGYGAVDAVTVVDGGAGYTAPVVEFGLPDDPNGVQATGHALTDGGGTVTSIVVDTPGSGYRTAPPVAVHNGTLFDPIPGATPATVTSTLKLDAVVITAFGAGYSSAPGVTVAPDTGGTGSGAAATAHTSVGAVTAITVTNPGSGYITPGIRKFVDQLPGLYDPASGPPATAKYLPLAVPVVTKYNGVNADQYDIAVVQYRTSFSSDLPSTLVRGYVQLETPEFVAAHPGVSQSYPLTNELLDGTKVPAMQADGVTQWLAVTPPQWLGPVIAAAKDRPVRVVFHDLLPTGVAGDLFLPTDTTLMGSGMGPMAMADPVDAGSVLDMVRNPACTDNPQDPGCFKQNRATLHLHGGITPWISDGTPHQWITPAGENTDWPQGVSVQEVPDMPGYESQMDGIQTFYYTNQQSARLLFYHDHSWGITRLNVYAGEAAGYLITDKTEQDLIAGNVIPGPADTIPLIVQDRTFVPQDAQLYDTTDGAGNILTYGQDPTWDKTRWGRYGDFWYHHVYMPAQNPGDPSGMSAYGRWMYGPWFWPPAANTMYGPIDNPYYDPNCNLDDPSTWQYQTDPFCEPQKMPGTPNISVGMEQFNDTPIVNGVAYPTITLEPRTYRLRFLNAANDRFFNFQWYVADPTQGNGLTEVALDPQMLAAAQTDPNVVPVPVHNAATDGPDWIQIGTEGGFLPAPNVVDGQQETTWITDPTRFDVGNVDKHSLLLAPAERADVIVDFSQFAGKTLIMYNDAPAAFPARVPSYDYYTGGPDMSPNGAPTVMPGYGPNTRTIMQVTIAGTPAPAFNMTKLDNAFKHKVDGSGVFESSQHPIIVGQAAYNSAYGTNFAASSNCNVIDSTLQVCDGFVRVNDTSTFSFNALRTPRSNKLTLPLQPKAIHDEMNATTFDEFGRMQANLGIEAQPPTPGLQNVTLYPYVNPSTELIDGTDLPKQVVTYDQNGDPVSDIKFSPIADPTDGTQIWRVTHNGVDTHPIHFHLYDVQVLNRVTWDNIIIPPDPGELGWKDTVRMSPLEDTIVALRPVVPDVPFELPNSIRPLNPMMPIGSTAMFNNVDPQGNPTAAVVNQLVNFGWEYVYHCHILSHEEMDMMRPVTLALPPNKPDGLTFSITGNGNNARIVVGWNDNSINETGFVVQRSSDGTTWTDAVTDLSPLGQPNTHGPRSATDPGSNAAAPYLYRVVAQNTVGYGSEFPALTVKSVSASAGVNPPAAPTNLTAALAFGPVVNLTWRDNATNEADFVVERSPDGVTFTQVGTVPARNNTGTVSYADATAAPGATYTYRVAAANVAGTSAYSTTASVVIPPAPATPTTLSAVNGTSQGSQRSVVLTWTAATTNVTGFTVQRATDAAFTTGVASVNAGATATSLTMTSLTRNTSYYIRIRANDGPFVSSGWLNATPFPILTLP